MRRTESWAEMIQIYLRTENRLDITLHLRNGVIGPAAFYASTDTNVPEFVAFDLKSAGLGGAMTVFVSDLDLARALAARLVEAADRIDAVRAVRWDAEHGE